MTSSEDTKRCEKALAAGLREVRRESERTCHILIRIALAHGVSNARVKEIAREALLPTSDARANKAIDLVEEMLLDERKPS